MLAGFTDYSCVGVVVDEEELKNMVLSVDGNCNLAVVAIQWLWHHYHHHHHYHYDHHQPHYYWHYC